MSTYLIGPPALSVRASCRRTMHHKARHFGVRATTQHGAQRGCSCPRRLLPVHPGTGTHSCGGIKASDLI
ncbi:hypothetical protein PBY51_003790 [Eleginops maclovinus]|uniref:Uncharacterized protein n=1 Tax=Eleginops maclovinus TaxID=56733 RepID=A0AAN7Y309_ELEMC|nr:hypothetical protein PBY51_003790 [Eleginops maclovinus]